MPGTNLTREEAQQRAAVISPSHYVVELDLSGDSTERFGSITTSSSARRPGASTFADLVDGDIASITLNGIELDPATYADSRIPLPNLQAENELRVEATCRYSHSGEGLHRFVDPVDNRVYLYTQFEVPDARRVFTTFEQPDLKATFEFHVTAPADWSVTSNSPTPEPEPVREGVSVVALRADQEDVDLHHRAGRRPLPPRDATPTRRVRRDPAGRLLPAVAGRAPRRRRDLHHHQAGLRVLRARLRDGLPLRQVRPALRPRVQHGRDGERRLRDLPRRAHLPQPPDDRRVRAAGQHDPARDGAHVVRRSRHDEVVGRPVAQRVVRRVRRPPLLDAGDPLHRRVDRLHQQPQELGLPAGPAAVDAPDRRRQLRPARGRGQLRRHHLRQGRVGAAAAGRLGRREGLLRRTARLLRQARLRQHRAAPTCSSSWRPRPDASSATGPRSGCRRRASTPCAPTSTSTKTTSSPASPSSRRPSTRTRRCAATGSPSACTTGSRAGWSAPSGSRSTSAAPSTPVSELLDHRAARPDPAQRRRPDLRQDPARPPLVRQPWSRASTPSRIRSPARCAGARPGT